MAPPFGDASMVSTLSVSYCILDAKIRRAAVSLELERDQLYRSRNSIFGNGDIGWRRTLLHSAGIKGIELRLHRWEIRRVEIKYGKALRKCRGGYNKEADDDDALHGLYPSKTTRWRCN